MLQQLAVHPLGEVLIPGRVLSDSHEHNINRYPLIDTNISYLHLVIEFRRYLHIPFSSFDPLRNSTKQAGKILCAPYSTKYRIPKSTKEFFFLSFLETFYYNPY